MYQQVFLDIDWIFVDFDEGVRQRYNPDWFPTSWSIPYKEFGTTFESFWEDLDDAKFWSALPWSKDGKRIIALVEPFKPTILTAAFLVGAVAGKFAWLKREYPDVMKDGQRRVLIANGKEAKRAIASPGKVLIDDNETSIDEWEAAGGIGILYPRPWNRYRDSRYPVEYLCSALMTALDGQ